MPDTIQPSDDYQNLLFCISETYTTGQAKAAQAVNTALLTTYWQIGQYIVEFEQGGKAKAGYGAGLLERLSKDLRLQHGTGFSRSSLNYMRLLYVQFPICETLSHKLSWSHYCELVKYATYGMNSQLFVSKYQLYLPEVEELRVRLEAVLRG